MNIYALPAIIAFTINFSIALIVLLDNPRVSLNRWFAAFILNFALWNVSEIIILNSQNVEDALFWAQILYRTIFFAPAFFVVIAYLYPRNFHPRTNQFWFYLMIFAVPVILLLVSFPNFQIRLLPLREFKDMYYYQIQFSRSFSFILLVGVFFCYLMWGSVVLIRKLPRLRSAVQKNQARFLLGGILTIFTLMIGFNALRSVFRQEFSFYFLSTILTFVISLFFLTAILQYRLFKTSRLVSSGVTYSILSSVILAIYFLLVQSVSESLSTFFELNSFLLNTFVILLLIILIRPLSNRLQQRVDRLLHRDIHEYRHNLSLFTRELLVYLEPPEFFKKIENFLTRQFQLENILVFTSDEKNEILFLQNVAGESLKISCNSAFAQKLLSRKRASELYDSIFPVLDKKLKHFFEDHNTRILLPLIFEENLLGILALSKRYHGQDFPEDMLEIFTIFANEAATAYHRNIMVDKMRQDERQHFRLEHLASLGQLTAGVAHEIRNPLNTISTSAETMLRKNLAPRDEKELKEFILEEAKRLNNILTDFLSLSKIQPHKFRLVNLETLLDRVIVSAPGLLGTQIRIAKKIKMKPPEILTDGELLFQVLLNLALNAAEAIREKCRQNPDFDCTRGLIEFVISSNQAKMILEVCDNGIGIPADKIERIFDPFYTTKETGTGLGLSIANNIIEALGGRVTVGSKGDLTVFKILLPLS